MIRRCLAIVLGAALVAVACARAGGETNGGELTPAGKQAETPDPTFDSTIECSDAGETWHELYANIFGATGKVGSCVYQGYCHGLPDDGRESLMKGIHCFDQEACYQAMKKLGIDNLNGAEGSALLGILRHTNKKGNVIGIMPQAPADYVFPQACIDHIDNWIDAGAPNN